LRSIYLAQDDVPSFDGVIANRFYGHQLAADPSAHAVAWWAELHGFATQQLLDELRPTPY
jgi:hypothetical protein